MGRHDLPRREGYHICTLCERGLSDRLNGTWIAREFDPIFVFFFKRLHFGFNMTYLMGCTSGPIFSPHDSLKAPPQTDPFRPNGAQKTSRHHFTVPVCLNLRNSYRIRANFADSYEFHTNVVCSACDFHKNPHIRTKFVRLSIKAKFQQKLTRIHAKLVQAGL